MVDVRLQDGRGSNRSAQVDEFGHLFTTDRGLPMFSADNPDRAFIFSEFLATSSGGTSMKVNPPAGGTDFFVAANSSNDIYIAEVSFLVSDAGMSLSEFAGTNSALANGLQVLYIRETGQEVMLDSAITTNFELNRFCGVDPPFDGLIAQNVVGNEDATFPTLNIPKKFGFTHGIRLTAGTEQRFTVRVRDDLSGLGSSAEVNVRVDGFERMPDA